MDLLLATRQSGEQPYCEPDTTFDTAVQIIGCQYAMHVQELTPGGQEKMWIQSQTTFAAIVKDIEGHFRVRVLKQKIWVKGNSYELQEIFGMDTSGHASMARAEKEVRVSQEGRGAWLFLSCSFRGRLVSSKYRSTHRAVK